MERGLALATGSIDVLRFTLGRALLRPWSGGCATRARQHLDRFDVEHLTSSDLLCVARAAWARSRSERAAQGLVALERRLLAAGFCLPLPAARPDV